MHSWLTADYHFFHNAIISYCKRPFKTVEEMNKTIINNHNEVVGDDDIVYFLGDFCLGNVNRFLECKNQLKGNFVFIKGNHDRINFQKQWLECAFIQFGGLNIKLVHNPKFEEGELTFCGHVHEKWRITQNIAKPNTYAFNVGVDAHGFKPIRLDVAVRMFLKEKYKKK